MMSPDDELTPTERNAFATLRRNLESPRILEERIVSALRAEGLLARPKPRVERFPWLVAAVAAGAVLYLGGIATGQWLANRQTAGMLTTIEQNGAMQAAALVQQTGSAYAQAIAALGRVPVTADSQHLMQGREVALTALYAAANQVVRLAPDDPVVVRILQVLDRERPDSGLSRTTRRVVWF
jgi:hypothetical protein